MPRSHAYVLGAKDIEKLRMQLFSHGEEERGSVRLPKVGVLPARKEKSGIWKSPKLHYNTLQYASKLFVLRGDLNNCSHVDPNHY